MIVVDERRVQDLTSELDELIPREGSLVRIQLVGGGPDESYWVGNRLGYLRLGVELLKGAFAPPAPDASEHVVVFDDSVLDDTSDVEFQWFERREDIVRGQPHPPRGSRIGPVLMAAGCLLALLVFAVGLVTIASWLL
jgi:hypothetical protein